MMMGEAVVSFRPEITENLRFYRKQSAQLASKLRYLSAQFIPYLENNLWLENAMKANISAAKLADVLRQYPEIPAFLYHSHGTAEEVARKIFLLYVERGDQ